MLVRVLMAIGLYVQLSFYTILYRYHISYGCFSQAHCEALEEVHFVQCSLLFWRQVRS